MYLTLVIELQLDAELPRLVLTRVGEGRPRVPGNLRQHTREPKTNTFQGNGAHINNSNTCTYDINASVDVLL